MLTSLQQHLLSGRPYPGKFYDESLFSQRHESALMLYFYDRLPLPSKEETV